MESGYKEEMLSGMEKETIIRLFPAQQEQPENIDKNLQLVLERLAGQKRRRFGRCLSWKLTGRSYFSMNLKP